VVVVYQNSGETQGLFSLFLHFRGESGGPREVGLDRREIPNLAVELASQSVLGPLIELAASSRSANAGNNQVDCVMPDSGELADKESDKKLAILVSETRSVVQSGKDYGSDLTHGGSGRSCVSLSHGSSIAGFRIKTSFILLFFGA